MPYSVDRATSRGKPHRLRLWTVEVPVDEVPIFR